MAGELGGWEEAVHGEQRHDRGCPMFFFPAETLQQGWAEKRECSPAAEAQYDLKLRLQPAELGKPSPDGRVLGRAARFSWPVHDILDGLSPIVLERHDEVRELDMQAASRAAPARDEERDLTS